MKPLITDVKKLIEEYQSGLSASELARRYDTNTTCITRTLKRNGVTMRSLSEATTGRVSTTRRFKDPTTLVKEYQGGMSTVQLAEQYDTSATVINATLKRAGVPLRSLEQAWEMNRDNRSGVNGSLYAGKGHYAADGAYLSPDANGYLRRAAHGHPLAHQASGRIGEHVYQACLAFGIDAVREMEIHHIDEDVSNNAWDNLLPLTTTEHKKLHWSRLYGLADVEADIVRLATQLLNERKAS